MKGKIKSFKYYKWNTLIGFALFYNTVYIGRFNLNKALDQVTVEFELFPYQQLLLYSSVFVAYALGSLINGGLSCCCL